VQLAERAASMERRRARVSELIMPACIRYLMAVDRLFDTAAESEAARR
jgi:hypothetical protein